MFAASTGILEKAIAGGLAMGFLYLIVTIGGAAYHAVNKRWCNAGKLFVLLGSVFLPVWGLCYLLLEYKNIGNLHSTGNAGASAAISVAVTLVLCAIPIRNWLRLWKWRVSEESAKWSRKHWIMLGTAILASGVVIFLVWWYQPRVLPNGEFRIVESRGFGDTLKAGRIVTNGDTFRVSGPKFPERTMTIRGTRRAFGADCAQDLGDGGTAYWLYDPGTGMWKVRWDGLGTERTILLQRKERD
jgi:hypothetical protein